MADDSPNWSSLRSQELQKVFDVSRAFENLPFRADGSGGPKDANADSTWSNLIGKLEFGTLALTGEVGEFANIVKRWRRRAGLNDVVEPQFDDMAAELGDIYAYLLKLANVLDRDLEQIHLERLLRNIVRFEQVLRTPPGTLITVAGPSCAGKTTAILRMSQLLGTRMPNAYIERYERNPYLAALFEGDAFDCDASQKWFMQQHNNFVEQSKVNAPSCDLVVDQEPSAVPLVYSYVFFRDGKLDSTKYSGQLRGQLEFESRLMTRMSRRRVILLDADVDILHQRSASRSVNQTAPKKWLAAIRQRFFHIYSGLPNVTYIDTSKLSIDEMGSAVTEVAADYLQG